MALAAAHLLAFQTAGAQPGRPNDAAVQTACSNCHRDKFAALESNIHSVLGSEEWRERTGEAIPCRNCHGDVTEHIRRGGAQGTVFAFDDENPLEQAATCLKCHSDTHPDFARSPHATAGLTCTDCHSQHGSAPHAPVLLRSLPVAEEFSGLGARSKLCASCHDEIVSQFTFNERHRLLDGALECTSCHNPHEPVTRSLLGGFKQELCIDCHTDKGGPFVFEHPASRTEGCTACHSPHGSPNRHLLNHAQVAELCLTCHAAIPQFHLGFSPAGPPRFNLDTQCTNCHSSIHGSNFHPRFLR